MKIIIYIFYNEIEQNNTIWIQLYEYFQIF